VDLERNLPDIAPQFSLTNARPAHIGPDGARDEEPAPAAARLARDETFPDLSAAVLTRSTILSM
jgi:hypothetical protein